MNKKNTSKQEVQMDIIRPFYWKNDQILTDFYRSYIPLESSMELIIGSVDHLRDDDPNLFEQNIKQIMDAVSNMEIEFKNVTIKAMASFSIYEQAS